MQALVLTVQVLCCHLNLLGLEIPDKADWNWFIFEHKRFNRVRNSNKTEFIYRSNYVFPTIIPMHLRHCILFFVFEHIFGAGQKSILKYQPKILFVLRPPAGHPITLRRWCEATFLSISIHLHLSNAVCHYIYLYTARFMVENRFYKPPISHYISIFYILNARTNQTLHVW